MVNEEGTCKQSAISSQLSSMQWLHTRGLGYLFIRNIPYKRNIENLQLTKRVRMMASLYSLYKHKEAGLLGERTCMKAAIGEWSTRHTCVCDSITLLLEA